MKHSRKFSIKKVVSSCKNIKLDKQHLYIIMALFFIGVFIVVLTSSYAFFSTTIRGKEYVVSTGTLSVTFQSNNSSFNLTGQYPKKDSEGLNTTAYTFGVKNTGTLVARYQVRLVLDDSQSNIPLEYVKIAYKKNNGSYSDPIRLSDLNTNLVITSNDEIDPNDTDNFELKMWIDYDAPVEVAGKKFKGKIVIDAIQNSDDGYVVSGRPAIKLNKDSEGNIDMLLNVGDTFTDPGVEKVLDDKDVFTTSDVAVNSNVNTSVAGIYNVTYTVTDSDGNASNVVRTVAVGNEETLDLYTTPAAVVTAYSTDANKKVVLCSHIYASTDIYFNCEEQTSIETAMSTRNIGAIILKADVTKGTTSTITAGQDYLLVLNGHDITSTIAFESETTGFLFDVYGGLTIYGINGNLNGTGNAITSHAGSYLTIDGGTYNGMHLNGVALAKLSNFEAKCTNATTDCYPLRATYSGKYIIDNYTVTSLGKGLGIGGSAKVDLINSTFNCQNDNCVWDNGTASSTLNVYNTTITTCGYGISNANGSTININYSTITNGGCINRTASHYNVELTKANGIVNITNSTLNNTVDTNGRNVLLNTSITNLTLNITNSTLTSTKANIVMGNNSSSITTINDSTLTANSDNSLYDNGTGTVNIYSTNILSSAEAIANLKSAEINLYSGVFKSTGNSAINNRTTGTINLIQTEDPIYVSASADSWNGSIKNELATTGTIRISGNQANACTNNSEDTTSGLCVYGTVGVANRSTASTPAKIIVQGGTYNASERSLYNVGTGQLLIQDVQLLGYLGIGNYSTGTVKVCSSTFETEYDVKLENNKDTCSTGAIYYSNDVVFRNGTNSNPRVGNSCPDGTIELAENGVCPITAQDLQ